MKYYEITILTTHELADIVAAIMLDAGSQGTCVEDSKDILELIESKNWDYIDVNLLKKSENDSVVRVKGWFEDLSRLDYINEELAVVGQANPEASFEVMHTVTDSTAYIDEWKKYYEPILIGDIVIVPEWLDNPYKDKLPIFIDPGLAFGTGGHSTTRMCIELVQELSLNDSVVFDIGSGSGILSLAALCLGCRHAYLIDNDPFAVKSGIQNLERNGFTSEQATCSKGDLLDGASAIKADVVLANLTADILLTLSKTITSILRDGTQLVLSGILEEKLDKVLSAYQALGMTLESQKSDVGWSAVRLRYTPSL